MKELIVKRREMVEILKSNTVVELDTPKASYLLRLLECRGMLPPAYLKTLTDDETNELSTNDIEYYTGTTYVQEWEPEDD